MSTDHEPDRQHALWELVQTARAVERRFAEVFDRFGLTPAQYGVLASLGDGDGLNQAELARAVLVRPQSLGGLIDTLVSAGLLDRVGEPGRGRRKTLSLTPQGRAVLRAARPAAYALLNPEVTGLDVSELEQLTRSLRTLCQRLTAGREMNA